ncbi:threonine synthase [Helicobacter sp. MIT 05-5293]|uniref:threonine synthase n=1 Tax=Helicobacter sp. MIT 05-5293 TaxID=1548149 RepID=UPI00051CCC03|nr:threonine synthase [Helicobacter sp. MIT 05-5293]TLD81673.1 threonine synthase [Helicobacter sp. MIT 05-5293]
MSKDSGRQNLLVSTRSEDAVGVSFEEAILQPVAKEGGLYTFQSLPTLNKDDIARFERLSYSELCEDIFARLGLGLDTHILKEALQSYESFDDITNPAPVKKIDSDLFILELFHGPTRAFKDMALQPFGKLLSSFAKQKHQDYLILTATSGDTGPAALESFAHKENIRVVCLYPQGGTSDVQRLQMTTQNAHNLKVLGIEGDFDDAQSALKSLLADSAFNDALAQRKIALSAANSVNIGRIVFQIIYHIWAYVSLIKTHSLSYGEKLSIIVPSGNFGNILGAFYAKKMGLPIGRLVVASNPNHILTDFITSGVYDITQRSLIKSFSPAMDILKSSNVERVLFDLYGAKRTKELMQSLEKTRRYALTSSELALLQEHFDAFFCDDEKCLQSIAAAFEKGHLIDPHTAVGYYVAQVLGREKLGKCVIASTAEWSKFAPIVESAISSRDTHQALVDKEAIKAISQYQIQGQNVCITQSIENLFSKTEVHREILKTSQLKENILHWLDEA